MTEPSEHDQRVEAPTGAGRRRVVARTRIVAATPHAIFDLLADPSKHELLDGSGTVRGAAAGRPERLHLGSRFAMSMKFGLPYRITNEVVEFDEPTLIAWRHIGRHVWRYRLRPVGVVGGIEGATELTEVTEEFDWTPSLAPWVLERLGVPARNAASIDETLDRLDAHFTANP
jgi:Polyketide cyclase / dehydrase and lipid transport